MHPLAQTQQVFTHSKSTIEAVEHSTKSMLKEHSMLKPKKRHQSESLLLALHKQMLYGKIVLYFLFCVKSIKGDYLIY